jgi:hypothetical protein
VRTERRRDGETARPHGQEVALVRLGSAGAGGRSCKRRGGARAQRLVAGEHPATGVEDRGRDEVDRQRRKPRERARGGQRRRAHAAPQARAVGRARLNGGVTFTRIAWLVTVLACIVTGVALLLSGYVGYAAVFGAVGACAAINLR